MTNQDDQKLVCRDCGKEFIFTKGEKDFFESRGFQAPSRCPDCRKKKKQFKGKEDHSTSNANNYPGQMHQITCSKCKKTTEVPFKPRNPEGVLCAQCFQDQASSSK